MKPIIEIKGISKKYKVKGQSTPYLTLREAILSFLQNRKRNRNEEFWALDDISFNVNTGDAIGIIGKNGAGKSTLLKILSRITPPTKGEIICRGRIASLLEVGTGFHAELTGRENIYLNGSILGLTKKEINTKFDEIVAFAEMEYFLNTPLKHYSSGMQLRLAFSVAAHLEPEILIVDEVLAVGDVAFQNKCIKKISDVTGKGRTVIIVSHNMASISRLCQKVIWLDEGKIVKQGQVDEVVPAYLKGNYDTFAEKTWTAEEAPGDDKVKLLAIRALNNKNEVVEVHDIRNPIYVEFEYYINDSSQPVTPAFHLYNNSGMIVFISIDFYKQENQPTENGHYKSRCEIPGNLLSEDSFLVSAIITTFDKIKAPCNHLYIRDVIGFQVIDKMEGGSARNTHRGAYYGVVRPILNWETKKIN